MYLKVGYSLNGVVTNTSTLFLDGVNYALNQEASESSVCDENSAHNAVDGMLESAIITKAKTDQWWKVKLDKRILMSHAVIYSSTATGYGCNRGSNVQS